MAATLLLIILGVAIWLAFMGMAAVLVIRPDSVRITERFLCPPGTEMKVETYVYSYHRPGERAIGIYYLGPDGKSHNIKVKALLLLWGMFFVASLPIAILIVLLFQRWVTQAG
jgi:hypothetical protein